MKKILNIVDPPIATYQGISFILAILLCDENTKNLYYNNYINITMNNVTDYKKIGLGFTNVFWENYRLDGYATMDMYYIKDIKQASFIDFLKKLIDRNNYLLLFSVDEFYLSYSEYYNKMHFFHDTYIYGYDDENFHIMAYTEEKLSRICISCNEVKEAIYSRFHDNTNTSFCTFQPLTEQKALVDTKKIYKELKDYIEQKGNDIYAQTNVYGAAVYPYLYEYIEYISENEDVKIDLRFFRMFWEHKKVMDDRIRYLNEEHLVSKNLSEKIKSIEENARLVFSLATKYYLSKRKAILGRIEPLIRKVQEEEHELVKELLDELK